MPSFDRHRRLRDNPRLRTFLGEHRLSPADLVQPVFVKEPLSGRVPIDSMPGQYQRSVADAVEYCRRLEASGVRAVLLFGVPEKKDRAGSAAHDRRGPVPRALEAIRKRCPNLLLVADVCLCEYTRHGHCGIPGRGTILNDPTLKLLARSALTYARAGADVIAPSDMMDGRIGAIRAALDKASFTHLPILSYAVKYASAYYGPFRQAAESAPAFGDRRGYQMDPANASEAVREAESDLKEGADFLLVKPALGYGDILRTLRDRFRRPVGAYSVSGEYSMIKAAAQRGWLDERATVLESHLSLKRAGASFIVTYWAQDIARWLSDKRAR